MGCGDVRLLKTIGSVEFTGQERAALNKLTMPPGPLTLREMVEDVAGLVDLAALHQRGTTEHRRDRRP